ncbi:type II CAAX endopeptidase family protein [Williamsia sp. 1135]|uniref:CPBP family intramembrane glutamic endopeptidase n=1 Tax=Williamsia sp. 1135 TaxID=1889262 RepID=UPI000A11E101|nr:type II CAAX endopeptidase family protein [Williamsia sp. 1135]ORM34962.1 CPBP family intramembrane metalloprotease [Williamsia sp. 1135]
MNLRPWLTPTRPAQIEVVTDPTARRGIGIEIAIVLTLTFGLSAASSLLSIIEDLLSTEGLGGASVALNSSSSDLGLIDFFRQLLSATKLFAIAALGIYLIWRAGVPLARIGFPKLRAKFDVGLGAGLAALIGIPGLGLYLVARALDLNVQVLPSNLDETFWRLPMLVFSAIANSAAEEFVVVAYLITRLRQLGWSENRSVLFSAVLRGSYHLYQGFGAALGNIVMGLVFGRVFQRTDRIWPLVIGHALIDTVAFVGFALLRDHLSWLR